MRHNHLEEKARPGQTEAALLFREPFVRAQSIRQRPFEIKFKTRCIALCSALPISTVQRLWRLCQSKFSSRRTWLNSLGSIRAFLAISIAVILSIF